MNERELEAKMDETINSIINEVQRIMAQHPRCPDCYAFMVEIYNTDRPFCGPTGIWRCLNDACNKWNDPTFREVTQ